MLFFFPVMNCSESYRVSMVQQHLLMFPAKAGIWRYHVHSQMDGFSGVTLKAIPSKYTM